MSKKDEDDSDLKLDRKGLNRREFFSQGAAAGVGVAALGISAGAASGQEAPTTAGRKEIDWDYEADVVIIGAGATGLPAAIRALDLGASVILVEHNFDIGGRMAHSNGNVSLGGGDAIQERDRLGESDPDGFLTAPVGEPPEALEDDPDLLFRDMTDWSIVNTAGRARYKQNDPQVLRAWADNTVAVRQFLMDNHVRFSRIYGTHPGGGLSRARRAQTMFKLGDVTDMRAGTVTQDDAGRAGEHSSHFAVRIMDSPQQVAARGGPETVMMGIAISRPLEFSAKEKGAEFLLHRRMTEIIREEPFSGRVLGIKTSYSPRLDPDTGERLVSYGETVGGEWAKGVLQDERETVYIRARKAVIVGAGGNHGNPKFRSMFHPSGLEPSYTSNGHSWLGGPGRANNGDGIMAGLRIGANLAGMEQGYHNQWARVMRSFLATWEYGTNEFPGNPTFSYRRSVGVNVGIAGFEHLIAVNQVGKRFFNEMLLTTLTGAMTYPQQGATKPWNEYVQGDWRNCRPELLREVFDGNYAVDAAMAMNEGSQPPEFLPGPSWAIFDQAAIDRTGWDVSPPYTGDNGLFFKADTLEELAEAIQNGYEHQRVPLSYLQETVDKWNDFVAAGADDDFERGTDAPMHPISAPPFYAAIIPCEWHDSCGGLRINGKGQVLDMELEVIPGLYAGGESAGGHEMHGLGKACTQGYIAATNAVEETV